jgi:electron transfer flavoprotein beta subunit
MTQPFHIVVCGSIVPDPLQTFEPVATPAGPGLKNEMMLPAVFDPWAGHALFEAAHLAKQTPGSKVWLVALGPKAKLQQVMMTIGQKVPFELVALDGPCGGFVDAAQTAAALAGAVEKIPALDHSRLLLFGGWESAGRGAGATMQIVGERLGITDQFQGVDELKVQPAGSLRILERIEGGKHQVSVCTGPPAVCGWATGNLPEPPNNPQVGMMNMRAIMPALQKAQPAALNGAGIEYVKVQLPQQKRQTRIVKDLPADAIAAGVAHRLGGAVDTGVTGLAVDGGRPTVTRWFYRQRIEGQLRRAARPWVLTVSPGSFAPFSAAPGTTAVESVAVDLTDAHRRTTVEGLQAPPADQQTIKPDAPLLLVAGAGWTKKQADGAPHPDKAETLILGFLKKAGASLGSSKSLVDLSGEGQTVLKFMTHMNQVGQTGSTPRHAKGLSTCCHGEEPHVVGWRFINERRAINLDPGCGWAQGKADVVYVADAFEVMEKVNALL